MICVFIPLISNDYVDGKYALLTLFGIVLVAYAIVNTPVSQHYVSTLADWNYMRTYTATFSSTHSMPVVVVLPLPDDDAFWSHVNPDGSDIRVTVGTGRDERVLPSMLVGFDYSRHRGKVAVLTSIPSKEMTFRLYYGNPHAVAPQPFAEYYRGRYYAFRKDVSPDHWTVRRAGSNADSACQFTSSDIRLVNDRDQSCAIRYYRDVPYAEGTLYVRVYGNRSGADGVALWLFRDISADYVPPLGGTLGFGAGKEQKFSAADDDYDTQTRDADCSANPVWKYYYTRDASSVSADWQLPSFDDSSWDEGVAPFGSGNGSVCTPVLGSPTDYLFVRRWVQVDGEPISAVLRVSSDDGVRCYVNGHKVLDRFGDAHAGVYWNYEVSVPVEYLREGRNLVACVVRNTGGPGYFDAELSVWTADNPGYAVVFDTHRNPEYSDPEEDYVGIVKGGVQNHIASRRYTNNIAQFYVQFKDNKFSVRVGSTYLKKGIPVPSRDSFPFVVSAASGDASGDYRLQDFYFEYAHVSASVSISPEMLAPVSPQVSVYSPEDGAVYGDRSVHFDVSVVDPNGDMNGVMVILDGSVLIERSERSSFSFVGDEVLDDGVHELNVFAWDNEGIAVSRVLSFTVDTTPPVLEVNNVSYDGNALSFHISATDMTLSRCYYVVEGGHNPVDIPCDGDVSVGVASGTHLFVVAEDKAGYMSVACLFAGNGGSSGSGSASGSSSHHSSGGVVRTVSGRASEVSHEVGLKEEEGDGGVQPASPVGTVSPEAWVVVGVVIGLLLFFVLSRRA